MITISSFVKNNIAAKKLHTDILKYMKEKKYIFKVNTHSNYKEFSKSIENEFSDIYIVDYTEKELGKSIGKAIRQKTIVSAIIMVNVSETDLNELLLFRPSAILGSDWDANDMFFIISNIIIEMNNMNIYFSFKSDRKIHRIPYDEVIYFESNAHKVNVWIKGNNKPYCIMSKLDIIQIDMPDYFVRCHQSFIVNMKYVVALESEEKAFILSPSKKIYISRRMYADTVLKYVAFTQLKKR